MRGSPLHLALHRGIDHEVEITLQVATLLAAEHRAFEIREQLAITQEEYEVCLARLRRAARILTNG